MNTPSHLLLNLAVLGRRATAVRNGWWVAAGAVLPDVPILLFFLTAHYLYGMPAAQVWDEAYFVSRWRLLVDAVHSFPLLGAAWALARWRGMGKVAALVASMFLHAALDFPLHVEDAHHQFFPFSAWTFQSPVSYWDPRHHGRLGATLELALVLASCVLLARRTSSRRRLGLSVVGALYLTAWVAFVVWPGVASAR